MAKTMMTAQLMEQIAERFKALAEPARLQLLQVLRQGECTVTELVEETGLGQANVSKHLQLLHAMKFVKRRKDGIHVYYALADQRVLHLCELMCDRVEADSNRGSR